MLLKFHTKNLILLMSVIISISVSLTFGSINPVAATSNAILTNAGFTTNVLGPCDDCSTDTAVPLGFTLNFFGNSYSSVYVNNNGDVTFDSALSQFTPFPISNTTHVIIAPYFSDVDTRNTGSPVTYGNDTVNGHPAFGVNWINVDCYFSGAESPAGFNSYQLVLIDRSDIAAGDFDIEFNYKTIMWETGVASGGDAACLGGSPARAGFSQGTGNNGTFFELAGSGVPGSFLDNGPVSTSLIQNKYNSNIPGQYIFQIRNGNAPNTTALITLLSTNSTVVGDGDVSDTAILSGATTIPSPSGTITFNVYNDSSCTTLVQQLGTPVTVSSNGQYNSSEAFTPTNSGTFYFQAVYSGDANNTSSQSTCNVNSLTVLRQAPHISAFLIEGTGASNVFNTEDTFTIKFSDDTNQPSSSGTPGTINSTDMQNYFTFSPSLGSTSLTGHWTAPSVLSVTVNSVDNNNTALIGVTTVTPTLTANIQVVGGESPVSLSTSPPLSGSFGNFEVVIPVVAGGTAVTVLPSGLTVSLQTGSNTSGTITVAQTTAPSTGPGGSTLQFLGNILDISGQSCSAANPCTVAFDFSSNDVNSHSPQIPYVSGVLGCGSSCPEVKIIHSQEGATTFSNADLLTPTITLTSTDSCYTLPFVNNIPACEFHASAQVTHPSRFAIGGIIPALAILGHGGGSSPPPSFTLDNLVQSDSSLPDYIKNAILNHDPLKPIAPSNDPSVPYYPLSIDGKGYLLGGYTNTLQTVTEKTGTPVDLQLVTYADSIQHMALYTNLHGIDPKISDSDTYVVYDAGNPLQTVDPHGLFSGVTFDLVKNGDKYKIDYGIKFAKTMSTSDIIIRVWNEKHFSSDVQILDAWQVVQGTNSQSTANSVAPALSNTATQNETPSLGTNSDMMPIIKKWGGYSSTSISDSELLKNVGINANSIPSWFMKTSKWVVDGDMTQQEFVTAIKYMYEKGIIK